MDDKLTERVSVRFSDSDFAAIKKYAHPRRLLIPDVIRMATIKMLREEGIIQDEPPTSHPQSKK